MASDYTPPSGSGSGGSGVSSFNGRIGSVTFLATDVPPQFATSANNLGFFASTTSAQLAGIISDGTGTGANVFNNGATLIAPVLGTPASGNLTNCTFPTLNQNTSGSAGSVALSGITGLGSNVPTALVLDLNGSGAITATTSPSFITPILGTPTSGNLSNCTALPIATGVSGLGTGMATALAHAPNANSGLALLNSSGQLAVAQGGIGASQSAANTLFGNATGSLAAPTFSSINTWQGTTSATFASGADGRFVPSVTGIVKGAGAGSTWAAATQGTDYTSPAFNGTWTAAQTWSANGASSISSINFTGTLFSGTGTTATPLVYINGGTAPTTWNTSGTAFGINLPSGSTANFLDFHLNGGASLGSLSSVGLLTISGIILGKSNFQVSGGGAYTFNGGSSNAIRGLTDGIVTFTNTAGTAFTALVLGPTTSSGVRLALPTSTSLAAQLGDGSANADFTAANLISGTVGKGLQIKSGTNAKIGSGTLVGGTLAVANTSITANSKVFVQDTSTSTTNVGSLSVSSKTAGTGFTVTSTNVLDVSTFDYWIVEAI